MHDYRPLYSDLVVEFVLGLSKRRQRKLFDTCNQLARNPFIQSDYAIIDTDGRSIEHIIVEGFSIAYWADHPVRQVMIVEVDDLR